MCNDLHRSFRTNFQCDIMDYCHECALPSNGMNVLVYNCVNVTLFCIFIVACCNFGWHLRFKSTKMFEISMSEKKRTNIFQRKVSTSQIKVFTTLWFYQKVLLILLLNIFSDRQSKKCLQKMEINKTKYSCRWFLEIKIWENSIIFREWRQNAVWSLYKISRHANVAKLIGSKRRNLVLHLNFVFIWQMLQKWI